ncbi:MAG: hypothetical protein ACYDAG_14455 [Chloroflexota bacterium]
MLLLDAFRVAIRWLHLIAAVAWVGGSIFYLLVIQPVAREQSPTAAWKAALSGMESRFRELVQLSIVVLLVSGAMLTFDRLQLEPGPAYVVTLGVKIALALWMFVLAQDLASRGRRRLLQRRRGVTPLAPRRAAPSWLILALGTIVLLLSDVLKVIGPK